ncbi:DNA topoisomerase IV subunit A, partial [Candidatus Bathyarchaeota archaeon]|nr:DNA topoisomerase IV subunit A [Candidatus Bathyarchaeota archaeon]
MEAKPRNISVKKRNEGTLNSLKSLGQQVYDQIQKREFPSIMVPSRSTTNIQYDDRLRQYVLGAKSAHRTSHNIRHVRPFTQLVWAADFAHRLKASGKTSTLRDVYYSAQAFDVNFTDQQESDNIITDLETVLRMAREDINNFPEDRSEIIGDLTIEYT